MPTNPRILKRQLLASTRYFRIEELEMEFGNGARRIYERLKPRRHGAVLIVAMPEDRTMLLVREYAAGLERYTLGLPKGAQDLGEDLLQTANRELYSRRLPGDEPEAIEVVPWRLENLSELLGGDDFCEERSIAALFMVRELLSVRMFLENDR